MAQQILTLFKTGFFGRTYNILLDGHQVGSLEDAKWKSRAEFAIGAKRFRLRRQGNLKPRYLLDAVGTGEQPRAAVSSESAWKSSYLLEWAGETYSIRSERWWKSDRILLRQVGHGEPEQVGRVRWNGFFVSHTVIDLPEHWPVEVRVLVGWSLKKIQEQQAAAAAG